MGGKRRTEVGTLSLREQKAWLGSLYPTYDCRASTILVCRGVVRPWELTCKYRFRIEYRLGHPPKTFVEEPKLQGREPDQRIPHTYSDEEVCLFRPFTHEWHPSKPLALTVVPWLMQWLVFYEVWFCTGEWHGAGEEPAPAVMQRHAEREEDQSKGT
jgi:hypothetical protein